MLVFVINLKQACDFWWLLVLCSSAIEKPSCLMGSRANRCGTGSFLSSDHKWTKFIVCSFSAPVFLSPQKQTLNESHKFISLSCYVFTLVK